MPIPTQGRMIRKSISESKGFAALSPQAAVLFTMIIPHLNSYGKLQGGHGYIKELVCPLITYLTYENIPKYLMEISQKTNMKWFQLEGRFWIHAVNFLLNHQQLELHKLGADKLPSYVQGDPIPPQDQLQTNSNPSPELLQTNSRVTPESTNPNSETTPNQVGSQVEEEVKEEVEDKENTLVTNSQTLAKRLLHRIQQNNPKTLAGKNLDKWTEQIRLMLSKDSREFDEVAHIIDWCQKDKFWKSNILSATKLREQYDQLWIKRKTQLEKDTDGGALYEQRKKQGRCTACGEKLKINHGIKTCPKCDPVLDPENAQFADKTVNNIISKLGQSP